MEEVLIQLGAALGALLYARGRKKSIELFLMHCVVRKGID